MGVRAGRRRAPHYLRRDQLTDLRPKLVGGLHGSCDECERRWGPTDGLVSGHYDNFVLRAKAQALVSVAQGSLSLRGAAHEVRMATIERRTGHRPAAYSVSRDGRLARDWVPQYTDIIAEQYLPKQWPQLITVDSFDVRVRSFDSTATLSRRASTCTRCSPLSATALGTIEASSGTSPPSPVRASASSASSSANSADSPRSLSAMGPGPSRTRQPGPSPRPRCVPLCLASL
jgi:hypothetical protein